MSRPDAATASNPDVCPAPALPLPCPLPELRAPGPGGTMAPAPEIDMGGAAGARTGRDDGGTSLGDTDTPVVASQARRVRMTQHNRPRRPLLALTDAASRALSVGRVFGEPIVAGGTTIVPVATVLGTHGLGYGEGEAPRADPASSPDGPDADASQDHPHNHPHGHGHGHPHHPIGGRGGGGGFGVVGWPAGAYVVTESETRWRPAVDANLLVLGVAALAGCVVTSIASVAAIKVIARTFGAVATSGAEAFASATGAVADSVTQVAGASSAAFASAAGSAAGALGTAAAKATEAVVAGAGAAQTTALGVTELGARALAESTGSATGAITAALRSR